MSGHRRAGRGRTVRLVVLGIVLAVLAVAPGLVGGDPDPGVGMEDQGVGTCHDYPTVEEYYSPSDTRPPVPCTEPHLAETIAVRELPADVASRDQRPSLEAMQRLGPSLDCSYADVVAYLGSDDENPHWFVTTQVRFPTEQEWADGERRFRCDAFTAVTTGIDRPIRRGSLRDVMERPESAAVRPCLAGPEIVPCSRPHDSEVVGGEAPPAGPERTRFAERVCPEAVAAFLGDEGEDLVAAVHDTAGGRAFCVATIRSGDPLLEGTHAVQAGGASS